MTTMAGMDSRNVQVNLTANVSPYQRAMQDAAKATNVALLGVTKLGKGIDDLVKRAGKRMVLIGASDIAALTAAAEAANRLDVAMSGVRANSAVTGQSVAALRGEVLNLSRSIPDSTNNIARLVGQVQALGIQGTKNISQFTVMAERLAAATNTAPGQLLSQIVQMNREMGSGLSTVSNYSSALIELSKLNGVGASDIMGFAQSIQAVAQQAGYTQTQVLGLATAFTRAGADSSAAANVFTSITSQINQAIVSNNAQLSYFAKLVGQTSAQFRAFAQSHPAQAFEQILTAIQSQGQKGIMTLQQLGLDGNRAIRVIAALTGGQANIAQSMNQASAAYARNNALTQSSNAAWKDLSSTMQEFRNQINDIVVRIGGPMLHVLNLFFEGANKVLGPINSLLAMMGPIPGIVAGIGGAFLMVTGTITAFSIALLAAVAAWRSLSGMTGTNTLQGLASGLRAPQGTPYQEGARTFLRQRPIDMTSRSKAANRIFAGTYGLGQRFSAPPPEDPTIAQRMVAATGRGMRGIAMFPLKKLGAEITEAGDTLGLPVLNRNRFDPRAIGDYTRRQTEAYSPYSIPGMFTRGQQAVHNLRVKIFGDSTDVEEKIKTAKADAAQGARMPIRGSLSEQAVTGVVPPGRPLPGEAEMAQKLMSAGSFGRTTSFLGLAGRGFGGAMNALAGFAGALSNVIFPLGILAAVGIPLAAEFKHLHSSAQDAANNMDDLGAALVRAAGGTYTKPQGAAPTAPSDKVTPFGQSELSTATSGGFSKSAGGDIGRLQGRQGINRVRTAQQLIQNVIASNNGAPLSTAQQQALREELIAAYGPQAAQDVYRQLNLKGVSASQAALNNASLLVGVKDDSNIFENQFQGTNSSKRIRDAVTPIANQLNTGQYAQAGLGLVAIQRTMDAQGLSQSGYNAERFSAAAGSIVNQLNKGVPKDQQIKMDTSTVYSLSDFINALQHGNQRAKDFANQLQQAGVNTNNLNASFNALNTAVQHSTTVAQAQRINATGIGGAAASLGINMSNPNDVNYARDMAALTYGAERGNSANMPMLTNTAAIQHAIEEWTEYKNTLSAADPAIQGVQAQIDSLNQALQQQNSIFQTPGQMAAGYANMAQGMISQFGTGGQAGQDEQTYIGMATQQTAAAEAQLKSYMEQVHQYRIQEKETFYERNIQIKQQNHEFAEQIRQMNFSMANAYGNPAQFVQAQYTEGAGQAVLGMQHQVQMLADAQKAMDTLHKQGLSRDAIRLLGLDDPKNVEQAQRYVQDFAQNPKLVQTFNASIKKRLKISEGLDTDLNNSKFADMKRQFDYNAHQAELAFEHAQKQSAQQISELGQQLYTNFDELNKAAMNSGLTHIQAYARGIVTAIGKVRNVSQAFINSTIAAIQASGGGSPTGTQGGVNLSGSRSGGGVGDVPVTSTSTVMGANGQKQTKTFNTYVAPGTGSTAGTGHISTMSTTNPNSAYADMRPSEDFMRAHPANPAYNQSIAKSMMPSWAKGKEWAAWQALWNSESGWNQYADNPTSSAYGIPQLLGGNIPHFYYRYKDWRTNPASQIAAGIAYIKERYGDPLKAEAHERAVHWYAQGGVFGSRQHIGVGENGPEAVIPLNAVGASFVASVVARTISQTGLSHSTVAMTHTLPRASVQIGNIQHHYDQSTNFTGAITVMSQDPNEMARKLQARKRLAALSRPVARTS